MQKLIDLGERKILSEVLPDYVDNVGDDCILVPHGHGFTVASTDPAPMPAAKALCDDGDPYWQGWLLVTINVSDIAAMGAKPTSFMASIDLPKEYYLDNFKRLLKGIKNSCNANNISYAGGNIRESRDDDVTLVGTALGEIEGYAPVHREGANENDHIYAVGQLGKFWSDYATFKITNSIDKKTSPIFSPIAQSTQMEILARSGLVTAAMDVSDGLMPSLEEMSKKNQLKAIVDIDNLNSGWVDRASCNEVYGYHARAYLGWGDWCVLCSVSQSMHSTFLDCCADNEISATKLGRFEATMDTPVVMLRTKDNEIIAGRLESERFAKDSWFVNGIQGYVDLLRSYSLS